MRLLVLATGVALIVSAQALAEDRMERSLKKLAPGERLVQLCDYTVMQRIRKDAPAFRPDHAVADATRQTVVANDTVIAEGGAFRSQGKWYGFTYKCTASPEELKVLSFNYKIGAEIPEAKWSGYGLWQ
jgi:hypothetical protein